MVSTRRIGERGPLHSTVTWGEQLIFSPSKGIPNGSSTFLLQAAVHRSIQARGQELSHSSLPCPQLSGATLLTQFVTSSRKYFTSFPLPKARNRDPHASLVTFSPPKHEASCDQRPGLLWSSSVISAQTTEEILKFWERAVRSPHHRGMQDKESIITDGSRFVERGMDSRCHKERHHQGKISKGETRVGRWQHSTSQVYPGANPSHPDCQLLGQQRMCGAH